MWSKAQGLAYLVPDARPEVAANVATRVGVTSGQAAELIVGPRRALASRCVTLLAAKRLSEDARLCRRCKVGPVVSQDSAGAAIRGVSLLELDIELADEALEAPQLLQDLRRG